MLKTQININSLRERTADDMELALDLLEMLKTSMDEYYSDIEKSINSNDLSSLASELHKFKSAIAILGFDDLAKEIANVEKNALKKIAKIDYSSKINRIFISLNNHVVELEEILKK